jgi:uncharacterized protein (DUF1330 family)/ADP-ribose pyrophosphatase YjhB (NUDIX family)
LPAYQLTEFLVRDRDELAQYASTAGGLVEAHGGQLLAGSHVRRCDVVEGSELSSVLFLHGWPSRDAFWAFYRSDAYRVARRHRLAGSTDGRMLLLEADDQAAIHAVAAAVIRRQDRLLVWEDHDPKTGEVVCVPLAGGIEFGESVAEAIARELREEIGATTTRADYLGATEDIYDWAGQRRHELYFVYDVELAERELYDAEELPVVEPDGRRYMARWRRLDEFRGEARLVPDGLLDLIDSDLS